MTEASALLRLQQIDIELLRHASTLQKLPQQEKLKKITGQRKDAEIDIVDVNADISHYRQVRERVMAEAEEGPLTHREARTVEESLTHLAKVTEKCEFRLGPLNEKLEKLKLAEANAQKMLGRLDEEEAATKKSFEDDSASVRAQILKLKDERDAACSEISAKVLNATRPLASASAAWPSRSSPATSPRPAASSSSRASTTKSRAARRSPSAPTATASS